MAANLPLSKTKAFILNKDYNTILLNLQIQKYDH